MKMKYNIILILILCAVILFGVLFVSRVAFGQKTSTGFISAEEYQGYDGYDLQLTDGQDAFSFLQNIFPASQSSADEAALEQLKTVLPEAMSVLGCTLSSTDQSKGSCYSVDYVTETGERILLEYYQNGFSRKQIRSGDRIITVDNQLHQTIKNVK